MVKRQTWLAKLFITIVCLLTTIPASVHAAKYSVSIAPVAAGVGFHFEGEQSERDVAMYSSVISGLMYQLSMDPLETGWPYFRDLGTAIGVEAGYRRIFTRSDSFIFSGGVSFVLGASFPEEAPCVFSTLGPQVMFEFPLTDRDKSLFFRTVIPLVYAIIGSEEGSMETVTGITPLPLWPLGGLAGFFFGYRQSF